MLYYICSRPLVPLPSIVVAARNEPMTMRTANTRPSVAYWPLCFWALLAECCLHCSICARSTIESTTCIAAIRVDPKKITKPATSCSRWPSPCSSGSPSTPASALGATRTKRFTATRTKNYLLDQQQKRSCNQFKSRRTATTATAVAATGRCP